MLTSTNANSVPMLTSLTISAERHERGQDRDQDAEGRASAGPGCRSAGGPRRAAAAAGRRGTSRRRSGSGRRGSTSTTLVIAISAPRASSAAAQLRPAPSSSAAASGASLLRQRRAIGSDADRGDRDQRCRARVQITSEPTIAIGRSRCRGSWPPRCRSRPRRSRCRRRRSAPAAVVMPSAPCGANGLKLSVLNDGERRRR